MDWKPGDTVTVTGYVYATSGPDGWASENEILPTGFEALPDPLPDTRGRKIYRTLTRVDYPEPIQAMILGWSTRQIGRVHPVEYVPDSIDGSEMDAPAYLEVDKTFKVWYVMPLDSHQRSRYRKPVTVLPEQIQEINYVGNI